ncbi:cell wall hydrolase [Sphingomonas gilva]|uniref:Cell wall hydrolase n=1 Tax=Sphingomonas gilva TaxID=2305907 RepID=A0A396RMJ0_9SPHN|nr:cell wall hydrolase [Sphingomonas gilva]RHW17647.1 cell wall hydrolase [Sphingomonas gilva]
MKLVTRAAAISAALTAAAALAFASPGIAVEDESAAVVTRAAGMAPDASLSTDLATDIAATPSTAPLVAPTIVDTASTAVAAAPVAFATLSAAVAAQDTPGTLDRELECLASATYFESRGEPLEGQLAVAEVIINRAESGRFADSICGVVHQPGQFSFVRGGKMPPVNRNSDAWEEAVAVAQIAQDEAWESKASDALFFHARRVSPRWRLKRVAAVGNHIFYR